MDICDKLPQKPERPLDSDCCGQGCDPCVLDIYEQELDIWHQECHRLTTGQTCEPRESSLELPAGPVLHPAEYRPFTVVKIEKETECCKRYTFSLPHGETLGLRPGQHVIMSATINGETVTRQYTPVSDIEQKSSFELLIKVYDKGKMSQYVRTWSVGTEIQLRGPCGNFIYKSNQYKMMLMVAVGTGITPMAQLIQAILNNKDDETLIQLHYGCRTYRDILLKARLDEWSQYWNLSCTYYLSQEAVCDNKTYRYRDSVVQGRMNSTRITSVMNPQSSDYLVLVCGTKNFETDMLKHLKVTRDKVHKF
ncbi:NADH-cytochrome b5 reductase-like isoform X1 [Mya arenaria]|uniref:NADH-cytochrome b5 reductase-like isoform X1 n=1 Tax=Mya arenaria TaxID=6604 RepID=UPI0022DFFFBB|nr:NADH-cytochrome b5 reductase-like isoform X1 [Mya arenaria]XP_052775451.1 NADH-cytochrome b5 reductase-like isoform X1 [Mya arenaria]XP_052775452.1 NADH-cytochrome b5 reductase-like isoform X1 [Mya arenaria]XP_052775453.1 NADH-cytochrome b5 reductase-like isoform X1 [Mya arenaria]XP_052775454.1 NADH-cytochrome b5 reductase-like isoform X1 [Mya arenaria]XP_052775455.1 NADH-cytochrome b5 reductase-like isoform X1 [Mya arenaria]